MLDSLKMMSHNLNEESSHFSKKSKKSSGGIFSAIAGIFGKNSSKD